MILKRIVEHMKWETMEYFDIRQNQNGRVISPKRRPHFIAKEYPGTHF